MQHTLYSAHDRGTKDLGWLISRFTFSFSSYANPVKMGFGLLKVFNDDIVQPGQGFGLHPHVNMEIISVMLKGSMNHKDSLGFSEVVHEDWVQIMSAGSGLRHEEYNVGQEDVNFLQIWIEPKQQNIMPRYQRRNFPKTKRINRLQTIVSHEEGQEHCWINQNAKLSLGYFEAGHSLEYSFRPVNKCLFVFNISGEMKAEGLHLGSRDAAGFWDTDKVILHRMDEGEYLLIEVPVNA
jgi:redox-sensitive bicupin YhaK (pirin superfamily)